jgi:hypothetical protein
MQREPDVETEAVTMHAKSTLRMLALAVLTAAAPLAAQQGGGQHPRKAIGLA